MLTKALLDSYLGQTIAAICPNGYDEAGFNHCAHFVNHVLTLDFGVNCRGLVGRASRKGHAANVRVQETFARCPGVRELLECPDSIEALIFISAPQNFHKHRDGSASLDNVPRKHVGLFLDGVVWHYSNSKKQVVTQTLDQFILHYPHQKNALWVGDLPPGAAPSAFVARPGSGVRRGG